MTEQFANLNQKEIYYYFLAPQLIQPGINLLFINLFSVPAEETANPVVRFFLSDPVNNDAGVYHARNFHMYQRFPYMPCSCNR